MANTKKWLVGISDFVQPPVRAEQKVFPEAEICFLKDWRKSQENKEEWRKVEALLVWHFNVDRETVELLDNCKIVVRYGAGYDVVDVEALAERGIVFCNTPGCGTTEVADTTCAMILSLHRKLAENDRACRKYGDDEWQSVLSPIERTSEQTLGVVGAGRIGSAVIERMRAFGYRILVYDPYVRAKPEGCEMAETIEQLQCEADIITLHCPLTDGTRGMVDAEFISKMKAGSSLVNASRGGVLAGLDCIEEALRSGQLASAAMDVLPDEPPGPHPLLDAWRNDEEWLSGRLLITPHVADYSEGGWYELHYKTAETARMYLIEGKLRNKIEP